MKKIIAMTAVLMFLIGCTQFNIRDTDGREYKYVNFGQNRSVKGKLIKTSDTVIITFDVDTNNDPLIHAINMIQELSAKAAASK